MFRFALHVLGHCQITTVNNFGANSNVQDRLAYPKGCKKTPNGGGAPEGWDFAAGNEKKPSIKECMPPNLMLQIMLIRFLSSKKPLRWAFTLALRVT